mgnify:CR=1 FL=1
MTGFKYSCHASSLGVGNGWCKGVVGVTAGRVMGAHNGGYERGRKLG